VGHNRPAFLHGNIHFIQNLLKSVAAIDVDFALGSTPWRRLLRGQRGAATMRFFQIEMQK